MKYLYITIAIIFIIIIVAVFKFGVVNLTNSEEVIKKEDETLARLEEKSKEALVFCKENDYNTNFCILIDMKVHSGKDRIFLWNFVDNNIEMQALCAHGAGKNELKSTSDKPSFSNTDGSYCTSLGKYKLGERSYSKWGINIHYKMHGLEETNNNAFKRIVVLHSFSPVPTFEIYPAHLPLGWSMGCPVTDNDMMSYLDKKLQKESKPSLLWIYY